MDRPLTPEEIGEALTTLPGWTHRGEALCRSYELGDFREALAFIVRIGLEAETMNHHPELTNTYSKVSLALSTHDAGDRVTQRDVTLARAIERLQSP